MFSPLEQAYEDLLDALYRLKCAELRDLSYGERLILMDKVKSAKIKIHALNGSGLDIIKAEKLWH